MKNCRRLSRRQTVVGISFNAALVFIFLIVFVFVFVIEVVCGFVCLPVEQEY